MDAVSEQLVLPIEQPISPLAHCAFRCGHTEVLRGTRSDAMERHYKTRHRKELEKATHG